MKIVDKKISLAELKAMSEKMFGNLVKAVIDIEKEIMAVDAEMHADEEEALLKKSSKQNNLWGINLYPEKYGTNEFIEYDSMINIRPRQGNRSRGVDDEKIRKVISEIILKMIKND